MNINIGRKRHKKLLRRKLFAKMRMRYYQIFKKGIDKISPSGDFMYNYWRVKHHHRNDFMKEKPRSVLAFRETV